MTKFFNTAGLCFPEDHYMVDPLKRFSGVEELIKKRLYFTINAPRQTGKTTYLHALARKLKKDGHYISIVASFERAGYEDISIKEANKTLISAVYHSSTYQLPEKYQPENPEEKSFPDLYSYLQNWCKNLEKPLVLLVDEIDALLDNVFVAVLRQFRDGYQSRPKQFPASVVLVGLRDVRDYKAKIRGSQRSWGSGSPFNIKSDSLFLKNFSREEVFELLKQHTKETGQVFPEEAKEEIFRISAGQPWLTNALANQIVCRILGDDFSKPITIEHVRTAKNQLILRRDTHLDSLVDKLKEDRVKRIVQAIFNGDQMIFDILDDDIAYVRDLGLVSQSSPLTFANPIYAEIVPRVMASSMQESLPKEIQTPWFVDPDGKLNMEKLLKEFQAYYRRNSGAWLERYEYKESAHHLLLMAFLERIVNSGGEINREMAVGNGRIDMLVRFKEQEFALELKVKWDNRTIKEGKEQLSRYLDILNLNTGYLVIFDPADTEWDKKIYWKEIKHNTKNIIMVGL